MNSDSCKFCGSDCPLSIQASERGFKVVAHLCRACGKTTIKDSVL